MAAEPQGMREAAPGDGGDRAVRDRVYSHLPLPTRSFAARPAAQLALTAETLDRFAAGALAQYRAALLAGNEVLAMYEINETAERLCHFLSQIAGACGDFTMLEESLNFASAAAIRAVWPMRFPTLASATAYVGNPRALAERVYGDRFGNRPGDGWRYRGRGFVQLTGRSNYREMGKRLGVPLEDDPALACHPDHALTIACESWMAKQLEGERDMNRLADLNKLEALTYRMSGVHSDLDDRRQAFQRAWAVWGEGRAPDRVLETGVLDRGDRGGRVEELNARLKFLGMFEGIVAEAPQHVFTTATYKALRKLQQGRGIALSGVAGADTWSALDEAMERAMRRPMPAVRLRSLLERPPRPAGPIDMAARRLAEVGAWSIALAFFALTFAALYTFALIEPGRLGLSVHWLPLLFAGAVFIGGIAMWLAARLPQAGAGARSGATSTRGGQAKASGSFVAGEEEPVRQGLKQEAADRRP